jgi:hypothetical protein
MQVTISVRLESELAEAIAEIAQQERRSVSAQCAVILEKFVQDHNAQQPANGE